MFTQTKSRTTVLLSGVAALAGAIGLLIVTAIGMGLGGNYFNPFKDYNETSLPFQAECTAKDSDGKCLKATCKKDADSDCTLFAAGCLRVDGYYAGSSDGGSCSRIL
jgi:hypothetical protein